MEIRNCLCYNNCECIRLFKNSWYGARHTQALLMFFLVIISFGMRVNLSVAIVAMTDSSASSSSSIPTYTWSNANVVLSSFYWGYVIPQILAGQLAKRYGPKWFLMGSMIVGSLLAIATPFVAALGSWAVILCRILQGVSQGFIYPSCHTLLSLWVPTCERARISTFVYAAGPLGIVLSLSLTGWISSTTLGWPYAFYIYGMVGLLWVITWIIFGCNSPGQHKTIAKEEKQYIEASFKDSENKASFSTPWSAIICSLPVWAILITNCGQNWGASTLITNTPTYFKKVLNFDIQSNGLLSAGPYFLFWVLSFVFSSITDYVITKNIMTTGAARKMANSIGSLVPSVILIILGIIGKLETDATNTSVALLFVAIGFNAFALCGYNINHMDLSPNHAGTLMGITNCFSNITSMIAPLFVQFIVTEQNNTSEWAIIFYTAAGMIVAGNTFFILFGSGDVQPWNKI